MLRTTSSIIMSFAVMTIVVSLTSFPCLAVIHGDVELLKTIALKHKANLESILTWKGEAFEERASTRGDSYDYMLKNKCVFAYDQLEDAVRWNREPQEIRFVKNGKTQYSTFSNYNSAMIKRQTSFDYQGSGLDRNNKATYHLVIGQPARVERKGNHGLDPRYFFKNCRDIPIYKKLMNLYDIANNPKFVEPKPVETYVKREEDHVTLTIDTTVKGQPIMEKFVFDLSAGGNLVEYYNKGPTYENHREYEYEEKSGVWVLKSFKKMNITHRKNGEVSRSTRTINWSSSIVNVPFEEDEFTLEKLGVKHGDDIHDLKVGMRYKYKDVLHDSDMLDLLDTADLPEGAVVQDNDDLNDDLNEPSKEVVTVAEREMLQTSETTHGTKGTRTYIYVIIILSAIGFAGVAYRLARRC
jgi:hypothetical protein